MAFDLRHLTRLPPDRQADFDLLASALAALQVQLHRLDPAQQGDEDLAGMVAVLNCLAASLERAGCRSACWMDDGLTSAEHAAMQLLRNGPDCGREHVAIALGHPRRICVPWPRVLMAVGDFAAALLDALRPASCQLETPGEVQLAELLAASDLAQFLGQPVKRVDGFLRRYHLTHPDSRVEVDTPRRNEPRFLYRTADVWPALQAQLPRWQRRPS